MGILNDNLEDGLDYKTCVINQLKDYVRKFYGSYSPSTTAYYEIEGYIVHDIEKLIYRVECPAEKIMGAYVCIGYTPGGLTISVLEENRLFHRLTEKNGFGKDMTFQKVVDFLSNYDPSKYSRDYNFFYNKYFER